MVAHFFPPMGEGGVFRTLKFARYLPEHGWTPVVLTADPRSYWVHDHTLLDQLPAGIRIVRTPSPSGLFLLNLLKRRHEAKSPGEEPTASSRRRGDRRGVRSNRLFGFLRILSDLILLPDSYIGWHPFAVRAGLSLLSEMEITVIYSTSPPDTDHIVARTLARRSGLPWIADFRDPWVPLHFRSPPTPLHRVLQERMERSVLEESTPVTTTRSLQAHLAEITRDRKDIRLIRNGYDPADMTADPSSEVLETIRKTYGKNFLVVYTGQMKGTRVSHGLLEGVRIFLENHEEAGTSLRMALIGPRENSVDRLIREYDLEDVITLHPYTTHPEAIAWQKAADLLLLLKHDDPRFRDMIPGKFYEYAGSGRPMLAVTAKGEVTDLIEKYRLGYDADPGNPGAVAEALRHLYGLWREERLPVVPVAPEEFRRPHQAARLAETLNEVAGRERTTVSRH